MAVNMGTAVAYLELDTSKFSQGFASAYNDLKVFTNRAATAEQKIKGLSSSFKTVGGVLSRSVTLPIAGIGTMAVKTASDFEYAMSEVKAISGATGQEFEKLKEKAINMGAETKFSAQESAEAFKYMAMAGWDAQSMMDGIAGIMDLAAASGEDLATTSDIVTDALTAFGLQAKDASHFADVLAQASSKSNTNVAMMGETFKYVAPVAGALGYSVEDTAVAIGLMANNGIKASQAGTSLRALLTRMAKPTEQVQIAMDKLELSLTNADGTMKPLSQTMEELRDRFSGMTEQQKTQYAATLAGQEAMSGLLTIVNSSDKDFETLTKQIGMSTGAAKDMADVMMDNTAGAVEQLKGALESAGIIVGNRMTPYIRKLADWVTKLTDKFNSLSDEQLDNVVKWGMIVSAGGPTLLIFSKLFTVVGKGVSIFKTFNNNVVPVVKAMSLLRQGVEGSQLMIDGFSKSSVKVATTLTSSAVPAVGLLTLGIGALSLAFVESQKRIQKNIDEYAKLSKEQEKMVKEIDAMYEASQKTVEAREQSLESINKEIGRVQNLNDELSQLVDSNGKVKEGNEQRAKIVVGQLSQALGMEIQITDGVIQKYGELRTAIDETIQKKKAMMVQEAYEDSYSEALEKQMQAQKEYMDSLDDLKNAQDEYNEALEYRDNVIKKGPTGFGTGWETEMKKAQEQLAGAEKKMNELSEATEKAGATMEEYNSTIKNYDALNQALASGSMQDVSEALMKLQEGFLTADIATRESLEKQSQAMKEKYEQMKQALLEGVPGVTQQMVDQMKMLSEQADQELLASTELMKQNLKTAFSNLGIEVPNSLINSLSKKSTEVQQTVITLLNTLSSGVALKKDEIKSLFSSLGIEAPNSLINQLAKQKPSVQSQAISLLQELQNAEASKRPEILQRLKDLGLKIDDNLANGMESGKKKVTRKGEEVGKSGHDAIQKKMDKDIKSPNVDKNTTESAKKEADSAHSAMQSVFSGKSIVATISASIKGIGNFFSKHFANGIDYVPYNNMPAILHEGERVLTKQENREYNRNGGIGNTGSGDTFVFYNTKPDPYQYAKQMKRAKRELMEGF